MGSTIAGPAFNPLKDIDRSIDGLDFYGTRTKNLLTLDMELALAG